jgi:hypothetical protein
MSAFPLSFVCLKFVGQTLQSFINVAMFYIPRALQIKELHTGVWRGILQESDCLEDMRRWKNNSEGDLKGNGMRLCGLGYSGSG